MLNNLNSKSSSSNFFTSLVPVVIINALISMTISFPLIQSLSQRSKFAELLVGLIPFTAHYFLLNLIVGVFTWLPALIFKQRGIIYLRALLFFLLQTLLLIDTRIYTIFHYHINSLVVNTVITEGANDSVILGKGTLLTFSVVLLLILLIEIAVHFFLKGLTLKLPENNLSSMRKASKAFFFAGLCLILVDKGMYAYGDLMNNTAITQNAKLYPLYQPFTIKRFASKILHIKVDKEEHFKVSAVHAMLKYPKEKLGFDTLKDKKYNILIIVVDGLRFDMLSRETMPNAWEFGQENIIFANHYSGGNGTRFGIFSLFYGIDGTYWHTFLAQRVSPVLVDTLIDKGYDFKILSSTRLTFPEFRKTAFIRIPESIEDRFENADAAEKDRMITEKCINFISNRNSKKPFFAFVFYDSTHQPYLYPKKFEKFLPAGSGEINYFKDADRDKISLLKNRYKNAVYYNDYLIGDIISSLRKNRLLKNTVVLITGDHGEEFYEDGYFGHTSSFDDYQTKTAFVLHYPGTGRFVMEGLTTHADLVPTLMESVGCVSRPENYAIGYSLLKPVIRPYILTSNWDNSAMIDNDVKIVFSTELYNISSLEVRKKDTYTPVINQREVIRQKRNILLDISLKMSEFYR